MIRLRRQLFLRAASRYGNLTETQTDQLREALEDPDKVQELGIFMHRNGAARLQRLQSIGRWIIENWETIARILGLVVMFLEPGPDSDSDPKEEICDEAPGFEFVDLFPLVRAPSQDASTIQGSSKV